jgi:anti-sigma28 factor (negative regulator of flagellin synthesis)
MRTDSQRKSQSAQPRKKSLAAKGSLRQDANGMGILHRGIEVRAIRRDKIDCLKRVLRNRAYRVSSEQIAEAMFRLMLKRSVR